MPSSITSVLHKWIEETLDGSPFAPEDTWYQATLTLLPQPSGMVPGIFLTLSIPSLVVGERVSAGGVIPNPVPSEREVEQAVLQTLDGLLAQRSGDQGAPQKPQSGLILP